MFLKTLEQAYQDARAARPIAAGEPEKKTERNGISVSGVLLILALVLPLLLGAAFGDATVAACAFFIVFLSLLGRIAILVERIAARTR